MASWMRKFCRRASAFASVLILGALVLVAFLPNARAQSQPSFTQPTRTFGEQDAAALMTRFRQTLENENRNRFLKLFDSSRMPSFPVFRDEVSQFFARYQPPQINYSIDQVSQDGPLGAVIAEFTMQATSWTDGQPDLHRRAQIRLVTSWDGKEWKIADLSPREIFQ